jgi:hypothetical protein
MTTSNDEIDDIPSDDLGSSNMGGSYSLKPEFAKALAVETAIPAMSLKDWEQICIDAEIAAVGMVDPDFPVERVIGTLSAYILKLSSEIRRLRLTHGEEVWWTPNVTEEEIARMRKVHEETKEQ